MVATLTLVLTLNNLSLANEADQAELLAELKAAIKCVSDNYRTIETKSRIQLNTDVVLELEPPGSFW